MGMAEEVSLGLWDFPGNVSIIGFHTIVMVHKQYTGISICMPHPGLFKTSAQSLQTIKNPSSYVNQIIKSYIF